MVCGSEVGGEVWESSTERGVEVQWEAGNGSYGSRDVEVLY